MKRAFVLVAAAAMAVTACGSSGSSTSSPATAAPGGPDTAASTPAASTPPTTGATSSQLTGELLSVSDLPTGWTSTPVTKSSGGFCHLSAQIKAKASGSAEADFENGNLPVLDEIVGAYASSPSGRLATAIKELGTCTSFPDNGITFSLGRMSFPVIGSQSAAFAASGTDQGVTVGFDLLVAQKHNQILLLAYGDFGTPSVTQLEAFAKQAIAKLP